MVNSRGWSPKLTSVVGITWAITGGRVQSVITLRHFTEDAVIAEEGGGEVDNAGRYHETHSAMCSGGTRGNVLSPLRSVIESSATGGIAPPRSGKYLLAEVTRSPRDTREQNGRDRRRIKHTSQSKQRASKYILAFVHPSSP